MAFEPGVFEEGVFQMAALEVTRQISRDPNNELFGGRDFVPYTKNAAGVIPDDLGFWPRGVRADTAGVLQVWFVDSPDARTLNVSAGEIILGPVVRIDAATTATVHLIK